MRKWFLMLLIFFLVTNNAVNAMPLMIGFSTDSLPDDEIKTFLKNINISMLTDEPRKKPIECFSVNENGLIAIGCNDSDNKTVCIYTDSGRFQYGYSFKCSGSFGVEMDENVLHIYFVRSDIAITVDPMGEITGIAKILDTSENNSYWNNSVFSTKCKVGNTEYTLTNDIRFLNIFASSYSRLTTTTEGKVHIVYDVNTYQSLKLIVAFAGVALIALVAIVVIVGKFSSTGDGLREP